MPAIYRPIRVLRDLPPEGRLDAESTERHDRDFKAHAPRNAQVEHAKDIAAFANTLGGVIIVGATCENSVVEYPGLGGQTVDEVKTLYEQAAQQACAPRPAIDPVAVQIDAQRTVVAINVEPFIGQPIAVKVSTPSGIVADAWRFPFRVASQTQFINPETLAMYMDPRVRRAIVQLAALPDKAILAVHYTDIHGPDNVSSVMRYLPQRRVARLEAVDRDLNRVRIAIDYQHSVSIPLRDILDVWPAYPAFEQMYWNVALAGTIVWERPPHLPQAEPMCDYWPLRDIARG